MIYQPQIFILALCTLFVLSVANGKPNKTSPKSIHVDKVYQVKAQPKLSATLKKVNRRMHSAIRAAIAEQRKDLGPLIIYEQGQIKLLRKNQEIAALPIVPPIGYQQLKVFGHMAFATVIQLRRTDVAKDELFTWIEEFSSEIAIMQKELLTFGFSKDLVDSQIKLTDETLSLLKIAKTKKISSNELNQYSKRVMPYLYEAIKESAKQQIDFIHMQVQKLLTYLSVEERAMVKLHLYGGRGARVGNTNIQYFSWLFGENTGQESGRIIFSENIFDHDKAMDLLARYLAERQSADLIFNDPTRLDRDLLINASKEYLKTFGSADEMIKKIPIK